MKIDILTLFPNMFRGPFEESIIKRAQDKSLVELKIHDLRNWSKDKHHTVDDHPYGGGVGMLLMVEPVYKALKDLKSKSAHTVLLDPGGKPFTQKNAQKLSKIDHLILIAAHYEGIDHRIREHLIDEEISIGDYVLTGGEIPAMVVADSVVRLIPGVLEKEEATKLESFSSSELEYPQYTRPEDYKGWKVPKILLSGDHKEIEKWRKKEAGLRTTKNRPDLL
ncbi:tRNA (guanosine(37)-N1)-methyltransferase TrmD [Candidatus Woesebacteria bacterium]|nr:tRNA (guanosine(37)-N1)-methyltransferase TrmD [Candidatus Woesebacteria bacterium]